MAKPSFMVDDKAPKAPVAAPLLKGFKDAELHPNAVEALKVISEARDVFAHRMQTVEAQYLCVLDGLGKTNAAQADAVRALMG